MSQPLYIFGGQATPVFGSPSSSSPLFGGINSTLIEKTKLSTEATLRRELKYQKEVERELRRVLKKGPYSDIEAGNYSDMKVKCFGKTFNLHRAVICPQSEWFAAALKPGTFIESATGVISLPEDDPRVFSKFVELLYLQELEETSPATSVPDLVKLYAMADKFKSPDAAEMARKLAMPALCTALAGTVNRADAQAANRNWDQYTESINYLYDNVPLSEDRLKTDTARAAAGAWRFLTRTKEEISTFLKKVPDFAIALASNASLFNAEERLVMTVENLESMMLKMDDG